MGWKEQTRKALVGPWTEIVFTIDGKPVPTGLHVAPKKLPTEVNDELAELQRQDFCDPGKRARFKEYAELLDRYKAQATEAGKGELKDTDLTNEQAMNLLEVRPGTDPKLRVAIYRKALAHGIGKHDFCDDGTGNLIGAGLVFDDKTIEEILEWDTMAQAIHAIIQEWNHPLAKRSAGNSGT